jgi:hypothetical protein
MKRPIQVLIMVIGVSALMVTLCHGAARHHDSAHMVPAANDQGFPVAAPEWPGDQGFYVAAPAWPGDPGFTGERSGL